MTAASDVSAHYSSGELLARLEARLREDGCDPARPTFEALAPYDHFHGRGLEATEDLANRLRISATDHVLDVGSGIGGPARYMARRFGCRVSGIDLTAEFCDVARHLASRLGLAERVSFEQGDALAMPFTDATFDGAFSMNVSMNIADKRALYREIHRVLKPGARLGLLEVVRGRGGEPDYPTPWARTAATSFLATEAETRENLAVSGFAIEHLREHDGGFIRLERARARHGRSRRKAAAPRGRADPRRARDEILANTAPRSGSAERADRDRVPQGGAVGDPRPDGMPPGAPTRGLRHHDTIVAVGPEFRETRIPDVSATGSEPEGISWTRTWRGLLTHCYRESFSIPSNSESV